MDDAPKTTNPLVAALVKICRDQPLTAEDIAMVLADYYARVRNTVLGKRPNPQCDCSFCEAGRALGIGGAEEHTPFPGIRDLIEGIAKDLGGAVVSVETIELKPERPAPGPRDDGAAPPLRPANGKH